jgi:hypothetical protein
MRVILKSSTEVSVRFASTWATLGPEAENFIYSGPRSYRISAAWGSTTSKSQEGRLMFCMGLQSIRVLKDRCCMKDVVITP